MPDQLDLDFWSSTNERYPDFKHKNTWKALWVEDLRNSPWVAAEIAVKAPGIVQFSRFACNWKLTKHVKDGRLEKVMQFFQQLQQQGVSPNKFTFIQTSLMDMYAKYGSIEDVWRVFNKMPSQNVVTWSSMILGHVKCGQAQKAHGLFQQMQQEGCVESVQQDTIPNCGHLECHTWRMCHEWPW